MRKRTVVVAAIVLALALVVAGLLWWRSLQMTELQRAVSLAPADAERLSWTDWQAVRNELGADLSAASSVGEVTDFLDAGYEADLTSTSALLQSSATLHEQFGFSPAWIDWELLIQSAAGAAVVVHLPESADFDELADGLEGLGYTRPSSETGAWLGGPDLLSSIAADLTPELQFLALDADRRILVASDTEGYLEQARAAATGESDGLEGLDEVVGASGEPLSAAIYTGTHACQALAMSAADDRDQQQADELVEAAGKVNPLTGFVFSVQPGRDVRVVMSFENEDQARTNADSRAVLARGPAPGQGGDFQDRFAVSSVTADGSSVTMALDPVEGQYVLSDLSTGPVLFATC